MVQIRDLIQLKDVYGYGKNGFNFQLHSSRTGDLQNTAENRIKALFCIMLQLEAKRDKFFPRKDNSMEQFAKDFEKCLTDTLKYQLSDYKAKNLADALIYVFRVYDEEDKKIFREDKTLALLSVVLKDQRDIKSRVNAEELTKEYYYLEEENLKIEQEKIEARPVKYIESYGFGYRLIDSVTGKYLENTPKNRTKALFCELLMKQAQMNNNFPNNNFGVKELASAYEYCLTTLTNDAGKDDAEILQEFLKVLSSKFKINDEILRDENFQRLVYDVLNDQKDPDTQTHAKQLAKFYAKFTNTFSAQEQEHTL